MQTLVLFLFTILLTSCATKPIVTYEHSSLWIDKYGVIHIEKPEPGEIVGVALVRSEPKEGQCTRLRDFVYQGKPSDWTLKYESAKQGASHTIIRYDNQGNTIALPYDCYNAQAQRLKEWKKVYAMKNDAARELLRRERLKRKPSQIEMDKLGKVIIENSMPQEKFQYYKGFTKDNMPDYALENHGRR